MSPTNILRRYSHTYACMVLCPHTICILWTNAFMHLHSGSARRTPTTVAHVEDEDEEQIYSVELFAPEPLQQALSLGNYHHGPEEEVDDDDDWAVQGANEWSPSGMQHDGEEEEEVEEAEKALARMLMPPPSLLPRLSGAWRFAYLSI